MMLEFGLWVAAWLYFVVWFFSVAHYIHMKDDGRFDQVPKVFQYSLIAGLVPGLLLDVVFNVLYGSIAFREFPREWLFSTRVKRHIKGMSYSNGLSRRERLALWWQTVLNTIDPGHI